MFRQNTWRRGKIHKRGDDLTITVPPIDDLSSEIMLCAIATCMMTSLLYIVVSGAFVALSVLAGVATSASALDNKTFWDQVERQSH